MKKILFYCILSISSLYSINYDISKDLYLDENLEQPLNRSSIDQYYNGLTLIGLAIGQDNENALEYLLKNGANPNKNIRPNSNQVRQNVSPLSYAIEKQNYNMVNLLIRYGALPYLYTSGNYSNYSMNLGNGVSMFNEEIIQYTKPIILAANKGNLEIFCLLFSIGEDPINSYDSSGFNALDRAFIMGNKKIYNIILGKSTLPKSYTEIPIEATEIIKENGLNVYYYPDIKKIQSDYTGRLKMWQGEQNMGKLVSHMYFVKGKLRWFSYHNAETKDIDFCENISIKFEKSGTYQDDVINENCNGINDVTIDQLFGFENKN